MNGKKYLALILTAVITLSMLAGCAEKAPAQNAGTADKTSGTAEQTTVVKQEQTAVEEEKADIRFVWWGGDARHKATLEAIAKYMEKNKNVRIEGEYVAWDGYYQKLVTQLAGGAAPDLIQISSAWFYDFSKQGKLFNDLYQSKNIDLSVFDKDFLKTMCEYDGVLQGLPTGTMADTIVFNKDFFKKHNIPFDTEWTWDSLIEVGTRVHKEDPNDYLMHTSPQIVRYYLRQAAGKSDIIEETYTPAFTEEMVKDAFTILRKMYDSGTKLPAEDKLTVQQTDEHPKWQKGQTGLFVAATSMISKIKSNSPFEIGVARYPVTPGAKNTGIEVKPSQLFSVNAKTKYANATEKFLNWLFTDEEAILTLKDSRGVPPTNKGMKLLSDNNLLDPLVTEATDIAMKWRGEKVNALSENQELYNILIEMCEKVAFNKAAPDAAAKEMMQKYNDKLAELKSKK